MKFLFVHQNFPGQFLHIVRHLAKMREHDIVFLTEPNANDIFGVRKVPYAKPRPASQDTHVAARELDVAVRRAEIVAASAMNLKNLGYIPDIMIGHAGWGEMLNLVDVWPGVPSIRYMEFYYRTDSADVVFDPEFPIDPSDFPRIRAKNAINHLSLYQDGLGVSPTEWQLSTYPEWARDRIDLLWEGVELDVCSPDASVRRKPLVVGGMTIEPGDCLVTYVSRDLEPYRGVHPMIRSLPHLMKDRKNLKVVMVGGDSVSYGSPPPDGGSWKDRFLKEVEGQVDLTRVAFPGRVEYEVYLSLLRRSDAHVYLTYPFVASWSLREAMAVGCAIVGSDTPPVREFVTHGETGLLTSFFDPPALAAAVLELVDNKKLARTLRKNARAFAERHLGMDQYLRAFSAKIEGLTGLSLVVPESRPKAAAKRGRAKT